MFSILTVFGLTQCQVSGIGMVLAAEEQALNDYNILDTASLGDYE